MFSSNTYTFLYTEKCSIPKNCFKSLLEWNKSNIFTQPKLKRTKSYSKCINIEITKNEDDEDDDDDLNEFNNFDISCYQFPPKDYSNIFPLKN